MQLVIMAAGMGSRFGGLKQMEPMDEYNHFLLDYSIYDAKRAGFDSVVFIIKKDIALEVNTGSFRNDMTEPNPSYDIIQRYHEMGGSMLTLGSDAHDPTTIADHFEKVGEHLKTIGFKTYLVYEKRRPKEHPL